MANFNWALQANAYTGFNTFYVIGGNTGGGLLAACASQIILRPHAARPSSLPTEALRRIAVLCVTQAKIRGKPTDTRLLTRRARAKPLLNDLERGLRTSLEKH